MPASSRKRKARRKIGHKSSKSRKMRVGLVDVQFRLFDRQSSKVFSTAWLRLRGNKASRGPLLNKLKRSRLFEIWSPFRSWWEHQSSAAMADMSRGRQSKSQLR